MSEPPKIPPPPAVDLVLLLGVGGGVVRPADDGRDPRRVEAADHRRHEPVLRVPVAELPVLPPAPRAQHIAREEGDRVAGAGGDEDDSGRRRARARFVGGGYGRVHLSIADPGSRSHRE